MRFTAITLAAALLAVAAPALAQQEPGRRPGARGEGMDPTQRIERRVQMLDERLDLTDDQVKRIVAILTQENEAMRAFLGQGRPESPDARDSMRTKMLQLRERTDADIAKVLNPTQLKRYQELEKEMRERGPERGSPRGRPRSS